MRKYRSNASTEVRVEFGIDLAEGLRSFAETENLAPEVDMATSALEETAEERRKQRPPWIRARAHLRFQEFQTDMLLRQAGNDAEVADGGRRGPIFNVVFPDGISEAVEPAGQKQLGASQKVYDRLVHSTHPNIGAYRDKWQPKLAAQIAKLQAAADQYNALKQQDSELAKQENAQKDAHALLIDKIAGHLRAIFPNDAKRQNAIFPASAKEANKKSKKAQPGTPA